MNRRTKEIRKYFVLSQEEFGKRLGVGRSAISNIENGNRNVTAQMAKSICREFGVSEEWLRTGEGNMLIQKTDENFVAEIERIISIKHSPKKKLITAVLNMSDTEAESLLGLINKIAE